MCSTDFQNFMSLPVVFSQTCPRKRSLRAGGTIHNGLICNSRTQGLYAEVEPLFRPALVIADKALGPQHPNVAKTLEDYDDLLLKTFREAEAASMKARAKAIRTKHKQLEVL